MLFSLSSVISSWDIHNNKRFHRCDVSRWNHTRFDSSSSRESSQSTAASFDAGWKRECVLSSIQWISHWNLSLKDKGYYFVLFSRLSAMIIQKTEAWRTIFALYCVCSHGLKAPHILWRPQLSFLSLNYTSSCLAQFFLAMILSPSIHRYLLAAFLLFCFVHVECNSTSVIYPTTTAIAIIPPAGSSPIPPLSSTDRIADDTQSTTSTSTVIVDPADEP